MSNTIFVRTRHHYAPYDDFFKLAELSRFPIIYVDEMLQHDNQDVTFVISPVNGEWNTRPHGYTRGRVILWQLEWNWDGEHNTPDCVAEVWHMDAWAAQQIGARYVPVGGDERLNAISLVNFIPTKNYDVALLSYQTPRRQVITQQLLGAGLRLAPVDHLWHEERSVALLESRVMVHVHQNDNMPGVAALRWCLAAAHRLPLISETVNDRGIFGYSSMTQSSYEYLPSFTKAMLKDQRLLDDYGRALHQLLCHQYTFRHSVESNV